MIVYQYVKWQLYKNIEMQFSIHNNFKLYIYNEKEDIMLLIDNNNETISSFIKNNPSYFTPIYPLPHWIVYKLYIDEGKCHMHDTLCTQICNIHK